MNVHELQKNKKIHLSLLPLFVTRTRKKRREKKGIGGGECLRAFLHVGLVQEEEWPEK